jgi:hypothetical protein
MMTWNQIRHFHKQPQILALWCRWLGPVLHWLTPGRRRLLLGISAVWVAIKHPFTEVRKTGEWLGIAPDVAAIILVIVLASAFVWLCYYLARRFAHWPAFARRHPQICLHSLFWLLLVWLWLGPSLNPRARIVLTSLAMVLPFLLWRLGYMLFTSQRGKMAGTRFTDHLFYIWPIWGGSNTPYGKGLDYLASCEAKDAEALAKSQLAGIKLFVLAGVCGLAKGILEGLVFGKDNAYRHAAGGFSLGIPPASEWFVDPGAHPAWAGWVAIYADLFRLVLHWAVSGHQVIGYLRLSGFYVFRNTYKPLLAETVVEFWNRYYYYFKELLVNFFFFPTFTRYFKRQPRLRLLAAVFAAAFAGNMYYHVIDSPSLVRGDAASLWTHFNSRLCYCFLLATGIYISMHRESRRNRSAAPRNLPRRALAIFGVWTFFAIIHIWAKREPASALERLKFFLGLLGVG